MSMLTEGTHLNVCTFRGLQNVPIFVAQRQGFFAAQGLEVNVHYTRGSAPQIAAVARGEYELIQTAPDNVICARSNPALFGLEAAPEIVLLAGGSVGTLSVYSQPHFRGIADLRGTVLGVDNPDSGFALVLGDMLARQQLELLRDYRFAVAGGTSERLNAVTNGTVAATLLYPPYDLLAETAGMRRLISSTQLYAAYASLATAGMRPWVEEHSSEVVRYITALLKALQFIYDPTHAEIVQAVLVDKATLGLDAATAAQAYAALIAPGTGFGETARLDAAGLEQVIALRKAYGAQAGPIGSAADYCDLRWYEEALAATR